MPRYCSWVEIFNLLFLVLDIVLKLKAACGDAKQSNVLKVSSDDITKLCQ